MPVKARSIFLIVVIILTAASPPEAANHYCVHGLTLSLRLDDFYHRDEIIIPQLPDESQHSWMKHMSCRWTVRADSRREDLQLVLEGRPAGSGNNSVNLSIHDSNSQAVEIVSPGMFRVYPLSQSNQFSVVTNWDPRFQKRSASNLRILLPLPGSCSRNMLSFDGSCYAVSAVKQNLSATMSSIRGDAQLASFSSMAEVSEFIAANNAKLNEFPYRRPISLDQPVRLGMFLSSATKSAVLSVVRSDSGCQLLPVAKSADFQVAGRVTGPCLSLRVAESDIAVIEFCDCSSPMLSLLSFPETARSVPSSAHCNGSELANLMKLGSLRAQTSITAGATAVTSQPETVHEPETSPSWKLIIGCASASMVLLAVAVAITVLTIRLFKHRRQAELVKSSRFSDS